MTYNKTIWTLDSGESVNADNLNKIEQGLADAASEFALAPFTSMGATEGQIIVWRTNKFSAEDFSGGGVGEYIGGSIAISHDDSALANDDGTNLNVAIGQNTLNTVTTQNYNIAIGVAAQRYTNQSYSVAIGFRAMGGASGISSGGNTNCAVGSYALENITTAYGNVAFGDGAGRYLITGLGNVFIGRDAGKGVSGVSTAMDKNVIIGHSAGAGITHGDSNVLIGSDSGKGLTSGSYNVIFHGATTTVITGHNNFLVGVACGAKVTTAAHNMGIGSAALGGNAAANTTGIYNTAFGYGALNKITTGGYNVAVGYRAGFNLDVGDKNVLLGYLAGESITTEDSKLHIANNGTTSLIEGDFVAETVKINGDLTITGTLTLPGVPTTDPVVAGQVWNNSGVLNISAG